MLLTTFLTYPFDLFHTRMATDLTKKGKARLFSTTFECFNRTHLDEGRRGLYKGVEASILSSMLRGAMVLPLFDYLFKQSGEKNSLSAIINIFGASALSSLILSLVLYPLDTAKRCLQLQGSRGH